MKEIVFVFPIGCYPVPAIKGGAVEALITNLIDENEKYKKFRFHVIMYKDINDKTKYDYSKYKHTKFYDFYQCSLKFKMNKLINAINKRLNYALGIYSAYEKFIIETIKAINPDFIIFEGAFNASVRKLKKEYGKDKIIYHVHHQVLPKFKIDKHFGKMLCVSEFVKNDWKESGKLDKDFEYKVLNNVLTSSTFFNKLTHDEKINLKSKYGIRDDDFILVYCGRLIKEKGIDILIKAVRNLKNDKIKLMIIGESAFKDSFLTSFVQQLKALVGEDKNIFFTGYVDNAELYKYYSLANLQVIPSVWEEVAGIVALEGRAVGLPQIITNSGGLPEYASKNAIVLTKEKNLQESLEKEILNFYKGKYSDVNFSEKFISGAKEYYNQFDEIFKNFK